MHRLVQLHGGYVAVHSDGPGQGSEFTIRLPLSRSPTAGGATAGTTAVRGPAARILVIEDNADARETLRWLLEDDGHQVDDADDGPSGLARAEATAPDVVLMDIGLPGMDGYEVARRLRAGLGARPILVALSGYGQADDRRRSLAAGFDAHLTKPVPAEALAEVLAGLARARVEEDRRPGSC